MSERVIDRILQDIIQAKGENIHLLPSRLEDLCLDDCSLLSYLPEGLRVRNRIWLTNSPLLQEFPEKIRCFSLCLSGFSQLLSLPPLRISMVYLEECQALRELHGLKGLTNLVLTNCPRLNKLPRVLRVEGDVTILGCDKLRVLPGTLEIGGNLKVIDSGLIQLPKGLKVSGRVELVNCEDFCCLDSFNFDNIDGGLVIKGNHSLSDEEIAVTKFSSDKLEIRDEYDSSL